MLFLCYITYVKSLISMNEVIFEGKKKSQPVALKYITMKRQVLYVRNAWRHWNSERNDLRIRNKARKQRS